MSLLFSNTATILRQKKILFKTEDIPIWDLFYIYLPCPLEIREKTWHIYN